MKILLFCLAGCAASATRPRTPLPPDPAARLAAIQARENQVRSLRARFSSVTRLPGAERSADGVLVVAKPDRFRLRLMLPFGITVFDYLNVGERTWMTLPLAGAAQRTQAGEFAPFSRDDLGQAFLRGAYAFPGQCAAEPAAAGEVSVSCREDGVLRRTLQLDAEGILEETSYDAAGTPRMVIRYADYRDVDGVALPFHITLEYPQRQQAVDISIDRYEVNPALSDDLFQPLPGETQQRSSSTVPSPLAGEGRDGG